MARDPDALLDDVVDQHLAHLEGAGPAADLTQLPDEIRAEAEALITLIDQARASEPLDEPDAAALHAMAARLGLDRAGPVEVDGTHVRRARSRLGLDRQHVVDVMVRTGEDVSMSWLARVERSTCVAVTASTAARLAALLECPLSDLEPRGTARSGTREWFLRSPTFDSMIDDWTTQHGGDRGHARTRAQQALLAVHRRGGADIETWRAILSEILDGLDP